MITHILLCKINNYLSNEIFYRVALARERWQARNPTKPTFPTGHFHVAWVQAKIDIERSKRERRIIFSNKKLEDFYSIYNFNEDINDREKFEKTSSRTVYLELSKLVKTVTESIGNSLNNFIEYEL